MRQYSVIWVAQFQDGRVLRQFDDEDQTREHLFKEVLDHQEDLTLFNLCNLDTKTMYRLNLETGIVHIIKQSSFVHNPEPDHSTKKVRLIYFRRMEKKMEFDGREMSESEPVVKAYFLGYQYNDELGKNHKMLLQVHDDDQVFISGD